MWAVYARDDNKRPLRCSQTLHVKIINRYFFELIAFHVASIRPKIRLVKDHRWTIHMISLTGSEQTRLDHVEEIST